MLKLTLDKEELEGRKLFFTSDPHFSHLNICRLCNRPYTEKWEMNKALIDNWNNIVSKDDIVFILGDFCFDQKSVWAKILNALNGRKHLVLGNHDKEKNIPYEMFESVSDMVQLWAYNEYTDKFDKFFLCHYPVLSYPGYWHGFYHLYGHVHTTRERIEDTYTDAAYVKGVITRGFDVGVDNCFYMPISREQVLCIINSNI